MWTQGTIGIPSGNGGMTSVSYWVKHYENESQFGIDNGRISKLTLVQDSKVGEVFYLKLKLFGNTPA